MTTTLRTARAFAMLALLMTSTLSVTAQHLGDDKAGQEMINDPNPQTFIVTGLKPPPKSVSDMSVQGGRSLHVPVTGNGTPSDIAVTVPITKPVRAGDKLVMMFYAKLEKPAPGEANTRITAQIQLLSAPYSVVLGQTKEIFTDWQLFALEGRSDKDYAKGSLNATFHVNTGKHTVALGLVAIFDRGQ